MKALIFAFVALFAVQTVSAQSGFSDEKKSEIVDNLKEAIVSENTGLQTSGALVLSELIHDSFLEKDDASKVMIPLVKLLKEGETEQERIAAAVALYQLGNSIGIYQLRNVGVFDSNEKIASICKNLYYTYHKLNGTEYLASF
ncbi:MAG: hypothetical protein EHM47_04520 [Ignavibacteriales bacterium]|nr:MAG: hypothetical protein EHM47_04520 [Ignavibacteriales bacterium]